VKIRVQNAVAIEPIDQFWRFPVLSSPITTLDHHYNKSKDEAVEIEYRLISWGEIYPPFLGDREHSVEARVILAVPL
jgi:hypothetical protein